jgi:hypothetical protein
LALREVEEEYILMPLAARERVANILRLMVKLGNGEDRIAHF